MSWTGSGPVPQGVAGELYIGGDGLARGYLRRPELTAERFVPDCCSGEPARVCTTGDLVTLEDGRSSSWGARTTGEDPGLPRRAGEIEAALFAHPAIREAAVVAGEDGTGGVRLIAYANAASGSHGGRGGDGRFLAGRVPDHMVPSTFEVLAALPSPEREDRPRALALREAAPARFVQGDAPRTPVEQGLAEIWAGVLGLRRVGIHEDFFERGGHSLLATRVIGQVRRTFDVELPLRALFESPTVARLAERVEAAVTARDLGSLVRADARAAPLSFAQRRLWLLDRLQRAAPPTTWRLRGRSKVPRYGGLERPWERSSGGTRCPHRLTAERGEPVQQVDPATPFRSLTQTCPAFRRRAEEEARRRVGQEPCGFRSRSRSVLRATLLGLGPERHVLMLTGAPRRVRRLVGGHLLARAGGAVPGLPRGTRVAPARARAAVRDFAAWQQGDGGALQASRLLAHAAVRRPVLELRRTVPARVQTYVAGATPWHPAELVAALRRLCRREGATLFMALVAGVQALFHATAGSPTS